MRQDSVGRKTLGWIVGLSTFVFSTTVAEAQPLSGSSTAPTWHWESPTPQGTTINDACVAEDGSVWAAGALGTLGRIEGRAWTATPVVSTEAFRHIACCANGVVAVGMNGFVARVRDGHVEELQLAGAETLTGVACSTRGAVISSGAGALWVENGASFVRRATPHAAFTTYVLGGQVLISGPSGVISSSADEGRTWRSAWAGEGRNLLSFAGASQDIVGVGAGGLSVRSRDGGATWSIVATNTAVDLLRVRRNAQGIYLATGGTQWLRLGSSASSFESLSALTESFFGIAATRTEWIAVGTGGRVARGRNALAMSGERLAESVFDLWSDGRTRILVGDQGFVARSTGTGALRRVRVPTSSTLHSVAGNARGVVLAVGQHGTILRSTNGGAAWRAIPTEVEWPFNSVWIDDAGHALAVGERGLRFRSDDSGATWQSLSLGRDDHFSGIAARDGHLWTIASAGRRIERSDDWGRTWTEEPGPSPDVFMRDLLFTSAGSLIVTGRPGQVFARTGAGTWSSVHVTDDALTGIAEANGQLVAVTSQGGVFTSRDQGRTWTAERPFTHEVLTFVTPTPDGRLFIGGYSGTLVWR